MTSAPPRRRMRRLLAGVLALGMFCLLLTLGFWQLDRARFKEEQLQRSSEREASAPLALQQALSRGGAEEWQYLPVRMSGRFLGNTQFLLDNRTLGGRAGYHVLTPFAGADGSVLVNRGWLPIGSNRSVLPSVDVNTQPATITGRLVPPPRPGLLLGDDGHAGEAWPRVVQSVDVEKMSLELGRDLPPAMLRLDPGSAACLRCEWSTVAGIGPERHQGYAVQWFSLAAALVVLMVVVIRLERRSGNG